MGSFTHLLIALFAAAGTLAAPTDLVDREPDFVLSAPSSLARRQNYNQDYTTGGNVQFSPSSNGYSVTFSNANDFVVGKGWSTGSAR